MKFFEKVKDLFTEEIEVEETPIKKEVLKVEIPSPQEEEIKKRRLESFDTSEKVEEREVPKEEKPRAPVFFDDKDFLNLDVPKVEKPKRVEEKKEVYGIKKEEVKKHFSPSPIISPVYGVLDKNYHKDDISQRKEINLHSYSSSKNLSLDDVMKKAYGTLEDDLESTMTKSHSFLMEDLEPRHAKEDEKQVENEEIKLEKNPIDPLSGLELDVKEDDLLNDNFEEEKKEENLVALQLDKVEEKETEEDLDLKESDLFNMIDEMYEKRDEE